MAKKSKVIRVGLAGLGRTGWYNHGLELEKLKGLYRVAAAFDMNAARLDEAKARWGCQTFTKYSDLVNCKDVDLVVVGLPNKMHADATIETLAADKHVVCEKPMATSLKDADRMVRAAKKAKGCLSIFQNRRYVSDFLKVREIIDSGQLGRVTHIRLSANSFNRRWDWQTLRKNGGGNLNNTGPHFVDMALQFLGDRYPDEFFVDMDRTLTLGDADDHVTLILKAKGAPVVEVEIMSDCAYPDKLWRITGTEGGLTGTPGELHWKRIIKSRLAKREVDERPTPDRSYNSEELPWSKERVWRTPKSDPGCIHRYYTELREAIMKRKAPPITAESIRRQMKLLEACHRRCKI